MDLNQDLLTKIRRLEEKEEKSLQVLNEQLENNKSLKRNVEELQKQGHDKDGKLSEASQVQTLLCLPLLFFIFIILNIFVSFLKMMSELKDEIRTLNQKLQIQDSKFSTMNLEKQALEEQLEMQQK